MVELRDNQDSKMGELQQARKDIERDVRQRDEELMLKQKQGHVMLRNQSRYYKND